MASKHIAVHFQAGEESNQITGLAIAQITDKKLYRINTNVYSLIFYHLFGNINYLLMPIPVDIILVRIQSKYRVPNIENN